MKKIVSYMMVFVLMMGIFSLNPEHIYADRNITNSSTITLNKGDKINIRIGNHTGSYNWKSSDKKIVTVDKKGNVVAKKKGTATVSVSINGKKYQHKVVVKDNKSSKSNKNTSGKVNAKVGFYCTSGNEGQIRLAIQKISGNEVKFAMGYAGTYERFSETMKAKVVNNKISFQMTGDFSYQGKCALEFHKTYVIFTNEDGYRMKLEYVNNNPDIFQIY